MAREAERTLEHAVRLHVVLRLVGEVGLVLGCAMSVPLVGASIFGEYRLMWPYAAVGGLLAVAGLLARRMPVPRDLQRNEALVVTAAAFVLAPLALTVPLAQHGIPWDDALFEAISGITTTGLSTLRDLEAQPRSFLLARAWMQWIGGLGFVVLSLALLMGPGVAARQLGAPTLDAAGMESSMRVHAKRMLTIYLSLSALGIGLLLALGAGAFDAVVHTLAGVSTGGFAPRDASLAPLGRALQTGVLCVSLLGAVSLPLYTSVWRRRWPQVRGNRELRALLVLVAAMSGLVYVASRFGGGTEPGTQVPSAADAVLLALSAQTTAGFSPVSVRELPAVVQILLVLSMISGGSQGSTAGGIKLFRILVMTRVIGWLFRSTRLPAHAVSAPSLAGERLEAGEVQRAGALILLFLGTVTVSWLLFLAYGYAPAESLFEVASATGTVGLSTGITRSELEPFLKAVLCTNMLLGRLEIFALLVALAPRTWIGRRVSS